MQINHRCVLRCPVGSYDDIELPLLTVTVPSDLQQRPDNFNCGYFCLLQGAHVGNTLIHFHGVPQTSRLTALYNLTKRLILSR
jgi:hypothetical protein